MYLKLVILTVPFLQETVGALSCPQFRRDALFLFGLMPDSIYRQILWHRSGFWCPILFLGSRMQIFKISECLQASQRLHCPWLSSSGWGTSWESSIDVYTLPCVKQRAGGKLLHDTGSPAWRSVTTRGAGGSRGRGHMNISPAAQQKLTQHCKAIIFQLKITKLRKKKSDPPHHHIQCTGDEI